MEYLVFPFGKYKGTKLKELPSTYIVLALEKFDLPDELKWELNFIVLGRLEAFSTFQKLLCVKSKADVIKAIDILISKHQPNYMPF